MLCSTNKNRAEEHSRGGRRRERREERGGEKRNEDREEWFTDLPILWLTRTVMRALIHVRLVIHKKFVQGKKERK